MDHTAITISENPIIARRISRILVNVGFRTEAADGMGTLARMLETKERPLVLATSNYLKQTLDICERLPGAVLCLCEQAKLEYLALANASPVLYGIMGIRDPSTGPRHWELLSLALRFSRNVIPPPTAPLAWGHSWYEYSLRSSSDREYVIKAVQRFCSDLQSKRQAAATIQLADELIMNAMYDAPVDAKGRHRYAFQRNKAITLDKSERPTFGYGSDGTRIVISITDPFGGLSREATFGGIYRGLYSGQIDAKHGGAGLGMSLIHRSAHVVFFDVQPKRLTQVTAVVELDVRAEEARQIPSSVYYFRQSLGRAASTPSLRSI